MNHSFNIDIAKKYDINQAIMIEVIKRCDEERVEYTFITKEFFYDTFIYWTKKQIKEVITELEQNKIIKVRDNNFYAIIDKNLNN